MRTVTLLDTSVASDNLGDQIIVQAVQDIIQELLPDAYVYTVATHEYMTAISKRMLRMSDFSIVAGTNILASNMEARTLWKLYPWDAFAFDHAVLLGCGWLNYMKAPNTYSRWLLRRILSESHLHASRDDYARDKIIGIGRKCVNVACPTMWRLTEEHCSAIPTAKANSAVITLTHYKPDLAADQALAEIVKRHYETAYFWPQQREDLAYFQSLGVSGFLPVDPSLRHYDRLLEDNDIDFIGTRLHGGIRALQKRRRALILAIDIRATEIGRTTGLPTVGRDDLAYIEQWIESDHATQIKLPGEAIAQWKAQFR